MHALSALPSQTMNLLLILIFLLFAENAQAHELPPIFGFDSENDHRWLVKFKKANDPDAVTEKVREMCNEANGLSNHRRFAGHCETFMKKSGHVVLHAENNDELDKLREALSEEIEYIEHDALFHSDAVWNLDRIDQRRLPLDGVFQRRDNFKGTGVHVYVVDTGIKSDHTEFSGRVSNGKDFVDGGDDPSDCSGHGTHVAGIALGNVYGVSPDSILHGVRVLGCGGSGTLHAIVSGLQWIQKSHAEKYPGEDAVVAMSLGAHGEYHSLTEAVNDLLSAGITVVASAGNSNSDACSYSPGRIPGVITVGSIGTGDTRSSFSNYGACVDVFAPGWNIRSAYITGVSSTKIYSGTSQAAPHVVGAAAAYLGANPGATVSEVTNAILNSATVGVVRNAGSKSPNKMIYCLLYTSPSPRDGLLSRMPSSA